LHRSIAPALAVSRVQIPLHQRRQFHIEDVDKPARPLLRYMSAWFCPFAHRCTIGLEHHA